MTPGRKSSSTPRETRTVTRPGYGEVSQGRGRIVDFNFLLTNAIPKYSTNYKTYMYTDTQTYKNTHM